MFWLAIYLWNVFWPDAKLTSRTLSYMFFVQNKTIKKYLLLIHIKLKSNNIYILDKKKKKKKKLTEIATISWSWSA